MKQFFTFAFLAVLLPISSDVLAQSWQQTNGPGGATISTAMINSQGHIFVISKIFFRSTDNGLSWQHISGLGSLDRVVQLLSKPTGELFALFNDGPGDWIYRSDDNGNTWDPVSKTLKVQSITILPT